MLLKTTLWALVVSLLCMRQICSGISVNVLKVYFISAKHPILGSIVTVYMCQRTTASIWVG